MELGVGMGASIYQGDLSPHWIGSYDKPGFKFQLMAQKNIFPGFAIRANYAFTSIRDNESDYTSGVHQLRNFSFNTTVNELSGHVLINPYFNNGEQETGTFHPYFFGGVGISFLRVQRDFSRFNRDFPHWQSWVIPGLAEDSMAAMPTSVITFPVGVGLRYQIGDKVALYGELTKRVTRNEYLDGFSKSANSKENDGFSSLVFGLVFRLSTGNGDRGRYDCPVNVY